MGKPSSLNGDSHGFEYDRYALGVFAPADFVEAPAISCNPAFPFPVRHECMTHRPWGLPLHSWHCLSRSMR